MENVELEKLEGLEPNQVAVVYGDGSANNNTGDYGAGCTGYVYSIENLGKKSGDVPSKYTITDIGYLENELLSKHKYQTVTVDYYFEGIFGYSNVGSNNRGELLAFIESVNHLLDDLRFRLKKILFKSDSSYTLLVIESMLTKPENEWRPKLIANLDLINVVWEKINKLKELNIELDTMKVLGHSTSLGNNIADRLAFIARSTKLNEFRVIEPSKHWTRKMELNPLLKFRQLFFINNHNICRETMYGIMDYNLKTEPGKKTHEAIFGLILPKEKDLLIDKAINVYSEYYKTLSILSTIDLNQLYSRNNTYYYSLFGDKTLYINRKNNTLCGIDDIPLIKGIYPSGLGVQAFDKMESLYEVILEYRNSLVSKNKTIRKYIDITEMLFDTKSKKKQYVCTIPNSDQDIELDIEEFDKKFKIVLSFGKDTLSRNQFKAIERKFPKVVLVLNRINNYIEYQTIIDLQDDDIAIYTNLYSCRVFLEDDNKSK